MATKIHLKKEIDMCSRPLLGKIFLFSLPLIATGILQLLYNAADIIVVGQFAGSNAMAAVGSTGALVNLFTNLFIGLSVGALASMAQAIGAGDRDGAQQIVHTSMLLSLIGGIIVGIFGFFMSKTFLVWMDTPTDILPLSCTYLKIFFIGMPFNLIYNFGSSILRASGDTKNPLIYLSVAGIINVILNLVFVIVFHMSVAGVAIATVISQAISAILIVIALIRRQGYVNLNIKKLKIHKRALIKILEIGLPAGIQSTIFSFSNVIIQSAVNSMGSLAVAGNTAAANIEGFVYISMNSISQATLTFTGQNFGANKKENCNIILIQTCILTTIIGLVMGVSAYLGSGFLLKLYNKDLEVIRWGAERLLVVGISYFLCGLMEVLVGALRGIGKSILPMFISIIGVCGVRILWIYTVFKYFHTPIILYLSYPVSWLFTCIIHFVCLIIVRKKAFDKITPTKTNGDGDISPTSENVNSDSNIIDNLSSSSNLTFTTSSN